MYSREKFKVLVLYTPKPTSSGKHSWHSRPRSGRWGGPFPRPEWAAAFATTVQGLYLYTRKLSPRAERPNWENNQTRRTHERAKSRLALPNDIAWKAEGKDGLSMSALVIQAQANLERGGRAIGGVTRGRRGAPIHWGMRGFLSSSPSKYDGNAILYRKRST